jgi:hypothetical protein
MRSKDVIRDEVTKEFETSGRNYSVRDLEREVDRRFHWERLIEEAEEYQKRYGEVRIEFMASPDDTMCKRCWELNGQSISIEELKRHGDRYACRCGVVLPTDSEEE